MNTEEITAILSIQNLANDYFEFGDAFEVDQFVELFTEDAYFYPITHDMTGKPAIKEYMHSLPLADQSADGPKFYHHISNHKIELKSLISATGYLRWAVFVNGHGADHWGRSEDEYRYENDRWLFSRRTVKLFGSTPGGWLDGLMGAISS